MSPEVDGAALELASDELASDELASDELALDDSDDEDDSEDEDEDEDEDDALELVAAGSLQPLLKMACPSAVQFSE
jgi:hypothetical protein